MSDRFIIRVYPVWDVHPDLVDEEVAISWEGALEAYNYYAYHSYVGRRYQDRVRRVTLSKLDTTYETPAVVLRERVTTAANTSPPPL